MSGGFCHLHTHSVYSFLDSTLRVERLVELAAADGQRALALTDTNGLYAAVPFYKACRAAGIKPIVGVEIDDPRTRERAIALARDFEGYAAICAMTTRRHLGADWDWARNGEGLEEATALESAASPEARAGDGGLGYSFRGLNPDGAAHSLNGLAPGDAAFDLLEELRALPPERAVILTDAARILEGLAGRPHLYAELILTPARRGLCRELHSLAQRLGLPCAAAADAHFEGAADYETYRVLRAIHYGTTIDRLRLDGEPARPRREAADAAGRSNAPAAILGDPRQTAEARERAWRAANDFPVLPPRHAWLTEAETRELYKGLRDPVDATARIAEACNLELPLGEWKTPRAPLPDGETAFSHLWKAAFEGVRRRYRPLTREAVDRLRMEMETIDRLGFCHYFLAVRSIAEEARKRGFPVLGRGSAANSIVSYALGLTGVDPIRHNLYFERFMNPERGAPPDIDLDFSWRDRDEILDWTYETYGRDRVAMICATITLRERQAIREAGKALGLAESEVNRMTRPLSGFFWMCDRDPALLAKRPECRGLPLDQPPWPAALGHARRILDCPRHLSIHCGGVLICPEPITRYTPLQRAAKGLVTTQMDMRPIEDLGLIKIDLLANRALGVYSDSLRWLGKAG